MLGSTTADKHIRRCFEMSETSHRVALRYIQNQGYPTVNLCGMGRSNKCPTPGTSKNYIFEMQIEFILKPEFKLKMQSMLANN
jgi:hypothetical protein